MCIVHLRHESCTKVREWKTNTIAILPFSRSFAVPNKFIFLQVYKKKANSTTNEKHVVPIVTCFQWRVLYTCTTYDRIHLQLKPSHIFTNILAQAHTHTCTIQLQCTSESGPIYQYLVAIWAPYAGDTDSKRKEMENGSNEWLVERATETLVCSVKEKQDNRS